MVVASREILGPSKLYVARSVDAPATMKAAPHRHSFYEIAWLQNGRGRFICDFESYDLERGALIFIAPGQIHTWQASNDHNLILIGFKPTLFAQNWVNPTLLSVLPYFDLNAYPFVIVPPNRHEVFDYLFLTIYNRYIELGVRVKSYIELSDIHEHILLAYLHLILVEAERLYIGSSILRERLSAAKQLTVAFQSKVEETFIQRWQIRQYADVLGVTPNYLAEVIRHTMGISPREFLQHRLFLEAQRLLAFTDETNAQIADRLSFTSPSQFGQWFKSHGDVSPGEFRRRFQKP